MLIGHSRHIHDELFTVTPFMPTHRASPLLLAPVLGHFVCMHVAVAGTTGMLNFSSDPSRETCYAHQNPDKTRHRQSRQCQNIAYIQTVRFAREKGLSAYC